MITGTALIVLTWVLFTGMGLPVWGGVLITVAAGIWIVFWMLFGVYFFNLDMKLMAAIQPFFLKHYDKRKRTKQI